MSRLLYIIMLSLFCLSSLAQTKKVALVIGNASYVKSPLRNPLNDADDVSAKLKTLGFEVIIAKDCKTKRDMRTKLDAFCTRATNADAGVFYYSGHGIQLSTEGSNYLIPIEAEMTSEADVSEECIALYYVLRKMEESGINIKIAIIDACRDNPFRTWQRGGSKGLSTTVEAPSGTFIAFATGANDVAADGNERNSPFTTALLSALEGDNLEINNVFIKVKRLVKQKTNGGQHPWTSNDLSDYFYFKDQINIEGRDQQLDALVSENDNLKRRIHELEDMQDEKIGRADSTLSSKMNEVLNTCIALSRAAASEDMITLRKVATSLREYKISSFTSLRPKNQPVNGQDSNLTSINGHLIFNEEFADSLAAGVDAYKESDIYQHSQISRGQTSSGSILTKTCFVKAGQSTTYTFRSTGHQELAVAAEAGGKVTMKIHVTNNAGFDKRYDDTKDVKSGRNFRKAVFDLPKDPRCNVTIEVINCGKKDISFVVISN